MKNNDFIDSDGIYDLSEFNNVSVDLINDVINDVFDTTAIVVRFRTICVFDVIDFIFFFYKKAEV